MPIAVQRRGGFRRHRPIARRGIEVRVDRSRVAGCDRASRVLDDSGQPSYILPTLAPSAARRFAMPATMPREPPVTSATLLASWDIGSPLGFSECTCAVFPERLLMSGFP